eukprot:NODE_1674_length_1336_cov_123.361305_g1389_i0.p1 GENE.NODE_1674_length_1336_cov_123.361305_g1389_i0~~NODE_1674_length_1336_cov_123.361305_g1389_i0.p1  ORF type:complete len:390 (-),score=90.58 NODE_1674_length_1336_cov_123.361305_g1389_i0:83-1252(-)
MAASKNQNITKDISSATEFEQELQLSWKESGIVVADVYSTIWGPCKAIAPTFRRLFFEADDNIKLRFVSVDCTQCLQELADAAANPSAVEPRRDMPRPKNLDAVKDTLPDFWVPIFQKHEGKAKPLFLFWKEGRFVNKIEGVHTPDIIEIVKDLSSIKTPADEFINNPLLLDLWAEYFNRDESEVKFEKFLQALKAICMLSVPLNHEETLTLRNALKVEKSNMVTAQALQDFVGPDQTLMQAFTRLLPNYEDRAVTSRLDEELAAKRDADGAGRNKEPSVRSEPQAASAPPPVDDKNSRPPSAGASSAHGGAPALDTSSEKGLVPPAEPAAGTASDTLAPPSVDGTPEVPPAEESPPECTPAPDAETTPAPSSDPPAEAAPAEVPPPAE